MKRHGFHGLKGQPRCRAQAPLARLDRRLRHAGARLQGHPDGRPDGQQALHRAEPDRAGVDTENNLLLVKGAVPGPRAR
jgi:ribosomal protein L3